MAIPSEWAGPPVEWAGLPVSPTLPYLHVSKVCLVQPGAVESLILAPTTETVGVQSIEAVLEGCETFSIFNFSAFDTLMSFW